MAVLKINGVDVLDPAECTWMLTDLSSENSGRSASGVAMKDRIAQKVKLSCKWPFLTMSQASELLKAVNASIFFSVTYPDPMEGQIVTRTFYVGDRTAPLFSYQDAVAGWQNLAFDLIQQ